MTFSSTHCVHTDGALSLIVVYVVYYTKKNLHETFRFFSVFLFFFCLRFVSRRICVSFCSHLFLMHAKRVLQFQKMTKSIFYIVFFFSCVEKRVSSLDTALGASKLCRSLGK